MLACCCVIYTGCASQNVSGGWRGRRLEQLAAQGTKGGGTKEGSKNNANLHDVRRSVTQVGEHSLEILPRAPETIDPPLQNVLRSIWPFLCSAAAIARHQNTWRETCSGQLTMTHVSDSDLRRVTNWSSGAPD